MSELSITGGEKATLPAPFSLLARSPSEQEQTPKPSRRPLPNDDDGGEEEVDQTSEEQPDLETVKRTTALQREDKLRSDLFILRKLNASLAAHNDALMETRSANSVRDHFVMLPVRSADCRY